MLSTTTLKISSERGACADLEHTTIHAILNTLLLSLLVAACVFRIHRLIKKHFIDDLSTWSLFLGSLLNISQVCIAVTSSIVELGLVYCHRQVASVGLGALNPLFLLIMSGVILVSYLVVLVLVLGHVPHTTSDRPVPVTEPGCSKAASPARGYSNRPLGPYLFTIFIVIYLTLILLPALLALTNIELAILLRSEFPSHLLVLPFLTFGQFVPQFILLWTQTRAMYETELDTVAFAIDTVQYILIGISWHQLLIETNVNVFDFFSAFWLLETSPLRALLIWFDYVVLGLGHGAALMLYLFLRWWRNTRLNRRRDEDGEDAVEERAPLLI